MSADPPVEELPPPMQCVYCGRTAAWLVAGTSVCRLHKRQHIALKRG